MGDINTGKSYLKTYDLLVKKAEDMLLPCVLAIDKTTCYIGGGGRLSLEPIIVSYGLMRHDIRKTPAVMRVLGFINTTPEKERPFPPGEDRPETPLPVVGAAYVTDAVWRTNEYHLQLDFILRESGYLALQESGLKWNLHTVASPPLFTFTCMYHSYSATWLAMICFVDTTHRAIKLPNFAVHAFVPSRKVRIPRLERLQDAPPNR